jgi:hypothetical protein
VEVSEILTAFVILNKLRVIYIYIPSSATLKSLHFDHAVYLYISHVLGTHLAPYSMTTGDDFPGIKAVRF